MLSQVQINFRLLAGNIAKMRLYLNKRVEHIAGAGVGTNRSTHTMPQVSFRERRVTITLVRTFQKCSPANSAVRPGMIACNAAHRSSLTV